MRGVAIHNAGLVGVAKGRVQLETPALVLDLNAFDANLSRMDAILAVSGLKLRPHAKSHKCAAIARRQLASPRTAGICCAKSGELLALFDAGIKSLLLTAPVSDPRKMARLAGAAASGCDLMVVADRLDLVRAYGAAARAAGASIGVLIDVDPGLGRTGVTTPEAAVQLASAIGSEPALRYHGLQAYSGQVQHIADFEKRRAANRDATVRIRKIVEALRQAGYTPEIVSGGGTGSALLDGEEAVITELQAGSYVFMDEGYRPVEADFAGAPPFAFSLFVAVSVIGHSAAGDAIVDAGSKSFAVDGPPPRVYQAGKEIGILGWAGDEFGRLKLHDGMALPPSGTVLECTVPHCDPTVNLHDYLHAVRGDTLIDFWTIEARGRSD